jgi:hypothetical protein
VYFGTSFYGETYVWDPAAIVSAVPHECRIYQLRRMDETNPRAAGGSFSEFVEWIVADTNTRFDDEESREHRPENLCFDRLSTRAKKDPLKRDVKLWLSFNNSTVRNLALSIRDEKRPDAFPILADALEEAGCTNADMLESCRRGDPDIDGLWVLRVLLGDT